MIDSCKCFQLSDINSWKLRPFIHLPSWLVQFERCTGVAFWVLSRKLEAVLSLWTWNIPPPMCFIDFSYLYPKHLLNMFLRDAGTFETLALNGVWNHFTVSTKKIRTISKMYHRMFVAFSLPTSSRDSYLLFPCGCIRNRTLLPCSLAAVTDRCLIMHDFRLKASSKNIFTIYTNMWRYVTKPR